MTPQFPPPDRPTDIYGAAMPNQLFSIEPDPELLEQIHSSANWFYWIGGLSLINSIITHAGGRFGFFFGLAVCQVADAVLQHIESIGTVVAIAFDVLIAALFCLFGWLANKRMQWVFWVGMLFYTADGLISLLAQDYIGLVVHGIALFFIFKGVLALQALRRMSA